MNKRLSLLIIDDDAFFCSSLSDYLSNNGLLVTSAPTGEEGVEAFEHDQPSLVLLDQELPDVSGLEVCKKILAINADTKIIFITAYATVPYAVEAMRAGAFDYLSKPFELDELRIIIDRAVRNFQLEGKVKVQNYAREKERQKKRLVGTSEAMNRIREQIKLAASSDANVLLTGETGVGKNVVARAIHDFQEKRDTFLTINCSAIPENLVEAEYFGHEKGVFTGANTRREGIFELADGGTLVLDEIGEVPMHLQSKLLAVLEDKRIRRIGSARTIPIDVRIIATTNQDLQQAIGAKRFRQDLFYRLAVFSIRIPPLREHPEDIPEIAGYFVKQFCRKPIEILQTHLEKMMGYPWPGNVRELRNVIERASLLLQGDQIRPADLLIQDPLTPSVRTHGNGPPIQDIPPLEETKKRQIISALTACSGNKSLAARTLGISLSSLKRKLKEMDMTQGAREG